MAKSGLKLEARPQPSKAWSYGSPVLALLVTVLKGAIDAFYQGRRSAYQVRAARRPAGLCAARRSCARG